RVELLGIIETVDRSTAGTEYDRGDHHRPGQRATPGFVDPGNALRAAGDREVEAELAVSARHRSKRRVRPLVRPWARRSVRPPRRPPVWRHRSAVAGAVPGS